MQGELIHLKPQERQERLRGKRPSRRLQTMLGEIARLRESL